MKIKIDKLDSLTSELVRKLAYSDGVATCEYCGREYYDTTKENGDTFPAWRYLQASHFIGRRYKNTRYSPENITAVCMGCHNFFHDFPSVHKSFFVKRLGSDGVERLEILARSGVKPDLAEIKEKLEKNLKRMGL